MTPLILDGYPNLLVICRREELYYVHVRFGSSAAPQDTISSTAAIGAGAAYQSAYR